MYPVAMANPARIFRKQKIITIKCGYCHSYIGSQDDLHFLFGDNKYNQCSLRKSDGHRRLKTQWKHCKTLLFGTILETEIFWKQCSTNPI